MIATLQDRLKPNASPLAAALARHGCSLEADDWARGAIKARSDGEWLTLEAAVLPDLAMSEPTEIDRLGLWKRVGPEPARVVFELPAALFASEAASDSGEEIETPLADALLNWAVAAAKNEVPQNWRPPAAELVDSWLPPTALTVRDGGILRRGELILAPERWALQFVILDCKAVDLPPARKAALDALAADAQNRCRMLRVGWTNTPDGSALVACVDFTGAPHSELLVFAGLDGLICTVARLAETAELLADVTVTLASPELCRTQNATPERIQHGSTY